MIPKIYDFNTITNRLKHEVDGEVVETSDYFEFYHTGIEDIQDDENQHFFVTDRYEGERSEILAWNFYQNENYSDVLLALNNEVYLWDNPFGGDIQEDVKDNQLLYVQRLYQRQLDDYEKEIWSQKLSEHIKESNDTQRTIVAPHKRNINSTVRKMREYMEDRKVQ
jgi:hypothetical protein